jgi:universal stress protein A
MSPITKILVPVDFSGCSRAALGHALFLSEKFSAPVHLLHVWHIPGHLRPDLTVWVGDVSGTLADHAQQEANAEMAKFLSEMGLASRSGVTSEVIAGTPATAIVETAKAKGCDLIVIGTHGRTGFSHLLLGSVAESVVRHAPCPVMTVRGPKEEK